MEQEIIFLAANFIIYFACSRTLPLYLLMVIFRKPFLFDYNCYDYESCYFCIGLMIKIDTKNIKNHLNIEILNDLYSE